MRFSRRRPSAPAEELAGIHPGDVADVESRWAMLDLAERRRRDELLVSRLRPLVLRRVPVRVVEAVPARRAVRIRFADGTAVMGRGEHAGDSGVLLSLVRARRSVWPGACSTDDAGAHLLLAWAGRGGHQMSVLITGLDQPD